MRDYKKYTPIGTEAGLKFRNYARHDNTHYCILVIFNSIHIFQSCKVILRVKGFGKTRFFCAVRALERAHLSTASQLTHETSLSRRTALLSAALFGSHSAPYSVRSALHIAESTKKEIQ